MGVQLINLGKRDAVVGIARNAEAEEDAEAIADAEAAAADGMSEDGSGHGIEQDVSSSRQDAESDVSAEGEQPPTGGPEE
jgi:DNA gyrase subunit A